VIKKKRLPLFPEEGAFLVSYLLLHHKLSSPAVIPDGNNSGNNGVVSYHVCNDDKLSRLILKLQVESEELLNLL
jgi:hypothetical protein